MKKTHSIAALAATFFTAGLMTGSAAAASILSFNEAGANFFTSADNVDGWSFTVGSSDILVTSVGWFDEGGDGLTDSHPVSIWATTDPSTAIVTGIVQAGLSSPLDGQFRFSPTAATILSASTTSHIGGYSPTASDRVVDTVIGAPVVSDLITYGEGFGAFTTGGLLYPVSAFPAFSPGFFGPSFEATVVPEPSSALLFGFGLLGFLMRRRKIK